MIPAFSPFLALRYLLVRRINLLAMFGVAFAVWAMIVVDSVFTGFVADIRDDTRHSAPDLLLTDLPNDTGYEPLRAAFAAEPGVVALAPRLRHHGMFQPVRQRAMTAQPLASEQLDFDHTQSGFALLLGIDPVAEREVTALRAWLDEAPAFVARHLNIEVPASPALDDDAPDRLSRLALPDALEWRARGRAGMPREGRVERHRSSWPGMLLGAPRARHHRHSYRDLQLGDPFDLVVASVPAAPAGSSSAETPLVTHSLPVAFAGWFTSRNRLFDETEVLLPIETLRTLLDHDASDPGSIDLATDVAVKVDPALTREQVWALAARLQQAAQRLLPPSARACSVLDWEQQNQVFLSAVAHEQAMMQFVLFVVMLVSAFVIYATLHMLVTQKVKDIGILAAVGGSPRGIGAVFLVCGLVVAGIGAALGIGLGVVSVWNLNRINDWLGEHFQVELFPRNLFDLQSIPVRLEPGWVATVAVGAVLLALAVAYVPARRAARMNPVEALSYE